MKKKIIQWLWAKYPAQDRISGPIIDCYGATAANGSYVPYGTFRYWWWRHFG